MDKKIYTRQELYELVWNEPLSKLAKKLNIETQYLKDICLESNIPLPGLLVAMFLLFCVKNQLYYGNKINLLPIIGY